MTALNSIEVERKSVPDPFFWLEKHGDYLYRFALSKLFYEQPVAEDLVQETLLAALKAQRNFANNSTERTWLAGILKHKIADHFRLSGREISLDDKLGENDDSWEKDLFGSDGHWRSDTAPREWNSNPAELLEQKEFREVLENCLAELPERLASVFILSEIQGYSGNEVCHLLNISQENLYVMLHRARLRLRHLIEKNWFTQH
jgi:RNA polymerase sigma-70 factor (ECF subfamily)